MGFWAAFKEQVSAGMQGRPVDQELVDRNIAAFQDRMTESGERHVNAGERLQDAGAAIGRAGTGMQKFGCILTLCLTLPIVLVVLLFF